MGVCCSQINNTNQKVKAFSYKRDSDTLTYKNEKQNDKVIIPITLDQVNKSIDEWRELTKRRKMKSSEYLEDKNVMFEENCLNELNREVIDIEIIKKNKPNVDDTLDLDQIDNEINQDFLNMNKKFNRGFSDISSTIHFTALNSKDFASSKMMNKFNIQNNHHFNNNNSIKSQSIVNVLDELNNNLNRKEITTEEKNRNFNHNYNTNNCIIYSEVKEISKSILEKSKITVRRKENNITNCNFDNRAQINSYYIINRSHNNNTVEQDETQNKNYNNATIKSSFSVEDKEFRQDLIFYQVKHIPYKDLSLITQSMLSNCVIGDVELPVWTEEESSYSQFQSRPIIYHDEVDDVKVEWKKLNLKNYESNMRGGTDISSRNKIIQGKAKNCSVVAALISINNYDNIFEKKMLKGIVNLPVGNYNESYYIKLYFNGVERKLEINDYFPFTNQNIFSASADPNFNLIEKAINILYNGNSFNSTIIKSNPSYEIYHLVGWLPEIIKFEDLSNNLNIWEKLYSNYTDGNIMINIGTNSLENQVTGSNLINNKTNLIYEHSYSIVDLKEVEQLKLFKCQNPWGHTIPNFSIKNFSNFTSDKESGCFWLELEDIIKHFSVLYLNWNPTIYPFKVSVNSSWNTQKSNSKFYDESYSLEYNPQFILTIPEHNIDFEVRILVTKHINSHDNLRNKKKTISYKLFSYEGFPIIYPIDTLKSMPNSSREVNSDVLIFETSNQIEQYVLVIMKHSDLDDEEMVNFTLDIYSFIEIQMKSLPRREILKNSKAKDIWHPIKLGGNLTSEYFINNPQYKLQLPEDSYIQIKLETAITTPIMIAIVQGGTHVSKLPYEQISKNLNPGFFFNSFSYFECFLSKGEYNIICVSQEEKIIGRYLLEVSLIKDFNTIRSSNEFEIEKLVQNNLGYIETLRGEWDKKNSFGYCESNLFVTLKNPCFIFHITQTSKLKFSLKSNSKTSSIVDLAKMTIILYKVEDDLSYNLVYDGSRNYCSAWGFYSDDIEIEPNKSGYVVVCINISKSFFYKFELEINSTNRIKSVHEYSHNSINKKNCFKIFSKWDDSTAGGTDLPSYYRNPQFEIIPKANQEACIELISLDSYPISFFILELESNSDCKKLCDIDNELLQNITDIVYMIEVNLRRVNLNVSKKYLVVPFTQFGSKNGYFDLNIYTNADVNVKEISNTYTDRYLFLTSPITSKLEEKIFSLLFTNVEVNKTLLSSRIISCSKFKVNSTGTILLNFKSSNNHKIGCALFSVNNDTQKKIIFQNTSLSKIYFGVKLKAQIKENTSNEYICVIFSNVFEYSITNCLFIDTENAKIYDYVMIDETNFHSFFNKYY